MKELSSFHDHIKFTFESNKENINFLDVNINLSNSQLMTNLYINPTKAGGIRGGRATSTPTFFEDAYLSNA